MAEQLVQVMPTMTLTELYNELHDLGVKTSPSKIAAMIQQDKYPFAVSVKMEQNEYEIYRVLFENWKSERIVYQKPEEPEWKQEGWSPRGEQPC